MIRHFKQRPLIFISAAFVIPVSLCCFFGGKNINTACYISFGLLYILITVLLITTGFKLHSFLLIITALMIPLGIWRYSVHYNSGESYLSRYVMREGMVSGLVYEVEHFDESVALYIKNASLYREKMKGACIKLTYSGKAKIKPYDYITCNTTLVKVKNDIFGYDTVNYCKSKNIILEGKINDIVVNPNTDFHIGKVFSDLKEWASKAFNRLSYGNLSKALVLGEKDGLSYADKELFSKVGLSHVLALSGLHISIIVFAVFAFFRMLTIHKNFACIAVTVVIIFYMALTGFSYSVVRAGAMSLAAIICSVFMRDGDSLNSLFFVMSLIVAQNPYSTLNAGLLLSFFATLGIVVFGVPFSENICKILKEKTATFKSKTLNYMFNAFFRMVIPSVFITVSAMIFTYPMTLTFFSHLSMVTIISNILVIPLISIVIIMSIAYLSLYLLSGASGVVVTAARFLIDNITRWIFLVNEYLSKLEFNEIFIRFPFNRYIAVGLVIIIIVAVLCKIKVKYYLFMPIAIILSYSLCAFAAMKDERTEIYCLEDKDVRLLILKTGQDVIVYKPTSESDISDHDLNLFLKYHGINKIKAFIMPIFDREYRAYFESIMANCKIDKIYHPAPETWRNEMLFKDMKAFFSDNGTQVETFKYDVGFNVGEIEIIQSLRNYKSFNIKMKINNKNFIYNFNEDGVLLFEPLQLERNDIIFLSGSHDFFYDNINSEYFMFDYSAYPDTFQNLYSDERCYDIKAERLFVFTIKDGEISLRREK